MRQNIIHTLLPVCLAVFAAAATLQSCADKDIAIPDYTVAGQPITLRVPIAFPEMDDVTRGDLSKDQMNRVSSLWIRTYNAETLEATCDWKKLEEEDYPLGVITPESDHIVSLNTKSGPSYIVAVANVDNPAVTKDAPGTLSTLRVLLDKADTWADFLNIAVPSPSDQTQLNAPQVNALPMAGCFSDKIVVGNHPEPTTLSTWQTDNFKQYTIPASTEPASLKGYIHLRRLVSHITFNFISGVENMELEVNSYQVMNAPKFSWLYERPTDESKGLKTNFGDAATAEKDTTYYADVPQFGSQFIKEKEIGGKTWQSFNFWQAENKHTGTCASYSDRDKKTIKDDVTLFTSLTGDEWTPNNEASYVIVDCSINYKKEIKVDAEGAIDNENGTDVNRSANATYIIHLGYINEQTDDFSCFRNVNYTYNVTVKGVNDIRVDAFATTEDREEFHGEEGLVVDLNAQYIELDAHYGVFNIQLTKQELENNFGFIIITYDNGKQITINENNTRDENGIYADDGTPIDSIYFNWIELRPTSGPNELALYKPRFNKDGSPSGENTFLLTDLYRKDGVLQIPANSISDEGYYTVFVNEYTYEPMYGEEGYGNEETEPGVRPKWMDYVNQNPRRFYIKVSYHESPDGNSVYARSKYAVEQQSLMTYYSQINLTPDDTAIGVERDNETFGLNLWHDYAGGEYAANGRINTEIYLRDVKRSHNWSDYVVASEPLYIPPVKNKMRLQGGPEITGGKKPLWKNVTLSPANRNYSFTDPQESNDYFVESIVVSLNRNRDNNGDGIIDPEELRWYVPPIIRYIGMTLGSNAMPQTLMEYSSVDQLPRVVNKNRFSFNQNEGEIDNCYYPRYMYVASNRAYNTVGNNNNNVLWAMEGTSLSPYANMLGGVRPWQVRCIRNLGSDLTTITNENKVTMPFSHDSKARKLTMDYFNLAAIRTIQYNCNGTTDSNTSGIMPVHTINSPYNSVYAAFEYAQRNIDVPDEYKPSWDDYQSHYFDKFRDYILTNPCANAGFNGSGWRVPNQIELTMMFNAGILSGKGTWLTCTVDYFDRANGKGSDAIMHKLYMGAVSEKTNLLSWTNYNNSNNTSGNYYPLQVRCVRDVNP